MTFDTRGHTMMGVSPEEAVAALDAWGADAIGGNCGNGPDELIPVIAKMHAAAPDVVLVAKSNAGMPELVDMRAVYRADPDTMAGQVLEMRDAGATIVGGCCGSTPDHLRAIAAAVAARVTDGRPTPAQGRRPAPRGRARGPLAGAPRHDPGDRGPRLRLDLARRAPALPLGGPAGRAGRGRPGR